MKPNRRSELLRWHKKSNGLRYVADVCRRVCLKSSYILWKLKHTFLQCRNRSCYWRVKKRFWRSVLFCFIMSCKKAGGGAGETGYGFYNLHLKKKRESPPKLQVTNNKMHKNPFGCRIGIHWWRSLWMFVCLDPDSCAIRGEHHVLPVPSESIQICHSNIQIMSPSQSIIRRLLSDKSNVMKKKKKSTCNSTFGFCRRLILLKWMRGHNMTEWN